MRAWCVLLLLCSAPAAHADEGMWPLNQLPLEPLKAHYQFAPSAALIEKLQGAAVRLGSASAALVSPQGLVLTNHHVARYCIKQLSSAKDDLIKHGFAAATRGEERKCPSTQADVLIAIDDHTQALSSIADEGERQKAIAATEAACRKESGLHCEMVKLYHGSRYHLYRYKRYDDVRLVFAPESQAADFGGDADNFTYPRFALDVAFVRVYENGKPIAAKHFLSLAANGVKENDLVMSLGNPRSTDRLNSAAELAYLRDVRFPITLASAIDQRAMFQTYAKQSPEHARQANAELFGLQNWLKAQRGEYRALAETDLIARKQREEEALRATVANDPERAVSVRDAFAANAAAIAQRAMRGKELYAADFQYNSLWRTAGHIVALAYESELAPNQRVDEFRESRVPRLKRQLAADEPIYTALEEAKLARHWAEALKLLGANHPYLQVVLGRRSPAEAAKAVMSATKLDDAAVRKALIDGGRKAVDASNDALIVLAREYYPYWRAMKRFDEEEVEAALTRAAQAIGDARFAVYGTAVPPDATGTLRLSFGAIKPVVSGGVTHPWHTNFYGLFARASAFGERDDFSLAPRLKAARMQLDLATPLNAITTLDIIGGASGSPVVDRDGDLVGVVFDGNLEGLGNRFAYDESAARSLMVDARAIREALVKAYRATALVDELRLKPVNRELPKSP